MKLNLEKSLWLALTFLTSASVSGALIYHIYSLNSLGIIISLILATLISIIVLKYSKHNSKEENEMNKPGKAWSIFYIATWLIGIYLLIQGRSTKSLVSPWEEVSSLFFIFFFLASFLLLVLIIKRNFLAKWLLSFHFFLSISAGIIVYKLGYGFDPFIHEATLELIKDQGVVTPKTWYYIGQYSLITIFHKITLIPISFLNQYLVPIMASIFLPFVFWNSLKNWLGEQKALFIILLLLSLPISIFIITVPQNLSYLFLLLIIALSLDPQGYKNRYLILLLALATLLTHPISGIPAILFSLSLNIYYSSKEKFIFLSKKYLYLAIYGITFLSMSLAFVYGAGANVKNLKDVNFENVLSLLSFKIPNQENFLLNFIYLYGFNWNLIILILVIGGLIIKARKKTKYLPLNLYLGMTLSLFLSYLIIASWLDFQALIEYERFDYAKRIFYLATIFSLPFMIISFNYLISKIKHQEKIVKWSLAALSLAIITASVYLSYPRLDPYHNPNFYSVSHNDFQAVNWIENDSLGQDYIVLANQQVSVTALKKFGFTRYYEDDIYFYPIPTGGKLYQYYLKMVYEKPNQKTMDQAMDLTGVDLGYLVLNKYWWAFDKIKQEAKLEADSWYTIDSEEVYIFKFTR